MYERIADALLLTQQQLNPSPAERPEILDALCEEADAEQARQDLEEDLIWRNLYAELNAQFAR